MVPDKILLDLIKLCLLCLHCLSSCLYLDRLISSQYDTHMGIMLFSHIRLYVCILGGGSMGMKLSVSVGMRLW